ncbi:hypothetical protein CYMTET_20148, partial [Cymbomonas tetramitiformis]
MAALRGQTIGPQRRRSPWVRSSGFSQLAALRCGQIIALQRAGGSPVGQIIGPVHALRGQIIGPRAAALRGSMGLLCVTRALRGQITLAASTSRGQIIAAERALRGQIAVLRRKRRSPVRSSGRMRALRSDHRFAARSPWSDHRASQRGDSPWSDTGLQRLRLSVGQDHWGFAAAALLSQVRSSGSQRGGSWSDEIIGRLAARRLSPWSGSSGRTALSEAWDHRGFAARRLSVVRSSGLRSAAALRALEALGEDTELVLAEAGVPGGPGRAAMLAAYQALSELGSGQAGRGPGGRVVPGLRAQRGLREAAWMGSLVRLLAESGHSLEEAFHLAWEQVHVQGEGGQEAKDLVEACLPLGRLHEDLCVPSAWPYASSVSGGSGWGGYIAGGLAYTEWPLLRTVGAALATELRVALEGVSELEIFCGASPLVLAGLSGGRLQESLSGGLASAASMAVDSEGGAGLAQGGTPRDAAAALWLCRVRAAAACATERGAGAGAGSLRALAHWLGQVAARVHVGALPGPAATLTVDRVAAELRMTAEVVTQLVGHPVVARLQTAMVRLAAAAELPPCLHELQAGSLLQAAGAVAAEAVAQAAASSETEMGTAGHTRRGVGAAGAIAPLLGGGHVSGVWFGSAAEEWHEVVGASGVLTALRAALYSANQQNAVYADSAAAVAAGTESAVQLSIWRREHSLERARKPPAHPCVDPLHPLFVAVAAFEAQMLDACAPRAWVPSDVEHALGTEGCVGVTMRQLQEGREELWAAAQSPAALPSLDALLVAWLHLRKAAAAALALAMPSAGQSGGGLTSGEGVQHTLDLACRAMDKAFNIPAGAVVARRGGSSATCATSRTAALFSVSALVKAAMLAV